MKKNDITAGLIVSAVIIGFVILAIWANNLPCDSYRYSTLKDVPVRCISHFQGGV